MNHEQIILKKVRVHNLKSIDLKLDTNELIVFTGVSGSGKSSLAFDTLYVEGQRRYVESLSTFARRQLGKWPNLTSNMPPASPPPSPSNKKPPDAIPAPLSGR